MPSYGTVIGSFFAQEEEGSDPVALRGQVTFRPMREVREQGSWYGRAEAVGDIQGGVLRRDSGEPGLKLIAGSWEVVPNLRDSRGRPVPSSSFEINVPANSIFDLAMGTATASTIPNDPSSGDNVGGWSVLDHGDGTGEIISTSKE